METGDSGRQSGGKSGNGLKKVENFSLCPLGTLQCSIGMTNRLQMLLIINLSKCIFLFKWQWEKQTDFNYSKWQILVAINTINGRCINRNCRQSQNKSIINRQLIVFYALNYNKSLVRFPLPQPKVLANLLFKTLSYWSYLYCVRCDNDNFTFSGTMVSAPNWAKIKKN